jgi:hypothetical protein
MPCCRSLPRRADRVTAASAGRASSSVRSRKRRAEVCSIEGRVSHDRGPNTFDVQKRLWSIYWVSGRRGCCLTDPVEGGFVGDRGEFYGTDDDEDRPVRVRYVWTRLGPDSAHWDQSFDYGDGKWEMNWENTLTRRRH